MSGAARAAAAAREAAAQRGPAPPEPPAAAPPAPVSYTALLLSWLCLGLLGGHHFLLGRHVHGLLWLTSGGGFGLGWFLDLFRLSRFSCDAAGLRRAEAADVWVSQTGALLLHKSARPGAQLGRGLQHFLAQLVLGRYYYGLAAWACRLAGAPAAAPAAGAAALALCVWAVDNCSRVRGSSLAWTLGCGAAGWAAAVGWESGAPVLWTLLAAQAGSFHSRRWRDVTDARDVALGRAGALRCAALLALLLALLVARLAALAAQGQIRARLLELLQDLGINVNATGGDFGDSGGGGGGGGRTFDFGGFARGAGGMSRREAARLLGVPVRAPRAAVREAHRRLSLLHHPDKAPPGGQAAAEKMQTSLNAARELLMKAAAEE